jgi:hypothetical protein
MKNRERIQDVVKVVSSSTSASIQQVSEDNLKELFRNTLDPSKAPTRDQYEEAKRLFKELGFRTFKDWHEYYLKRDVLLLDDGFTAYRKKCL